MALREEEAKVRAADDLTRLLKDVADAEPPCSALSIAIHQVLDAGFSPDLIRWVVEEAIRGER